MPTRCSARIPGAGHAVEARAANHPLHLTLLRRLARLAQVPLALNDARKAGRMRSTSGRNPAARIPVRL
jgi:hypothetical protein